MEIEELKHTKGDWRASAHYQMGKGGLPTAHVTVVSESGAVLVLTGLLGAPDEEESKANAKVMAAAPRMLQALMLLDADYLPADVALYVASAIEYATAELKTI